MTIQAWWREGRQARQSSKKLTFKGRDGAHRQSDNIATASMDHSKKVAILKDQDKALPTSSIFRQPETGMGRFSAYDSHGQQSIVQLQEDVQTMRSEIRDSRQEVSALRQEIRAGLQALGVQTHRSL